MTYSTAPVPPLVLAAAGVLLQATAGQAQIDVQAEIALRHITEARQFLDLRKTLDIGGVAVGVLLEKIVTPADDGVEGLVALERGNDMHLARLTDDDASGRQIQLDFTSNDIGNLSRQNRHGEKGESQHRKMPESVEPHGQSSLSSKTKR